jgi:prephenate dehydrogenase
MQVAVIGGTRGLGNWIANFLKKRGCDVIITGRNTLTGMETAKKMGITFTSNNMEAASQAEVVILAVPIEVTPQTIREVAPHLKEGSLLVDVTSVKEEPAQTMQEFVPENVEFLPTHPMFGPRVRSLEGQVVVLTPLKEGPWYEKVYNFLQSENARVLVTTPQKHDEMMSVVQGLTHFAYISIAATLERLQVDVKESRKFASPIYSLMLDMIARITAQNPYLCYSIQTHNRYIEKTHEQFISTYQELKDMISGENQEDFVSAMSSAAKHLNDLEAALGRSDKAISLLTEELRLLKSSMGEDVGLRHIYSGKIHVGILEEISADYVTLNRDKKFTRLKISNIEILSPEELLKWKNENYLKRSYDVSVVFSQDADPQVISGTVKSLKDVVGTEVLDVYQGGQIEPGKKSVTLRYWVINPDARYEVEKLLRGFGGVIR